MRPISLNINILFVLHLLIFLIVNHRIVSFAHKACTKACGKLKISEPFRIRGDPSYCGRPEFELVCEDDKDVVLYLDRHKYLVTSITKDIEDSNVVTVHSDCPFTTKTSTCRLEDNSSFYHFDYKTFYSFKWASFMNCSQMISNNTYMIVPSLSDGNKSHVYVTVGYFAKEFKYLHESCKFLDIFPIGDYDEGMNSSSEVIEMIQNQICLCAGCDRGTSTVCQLVFFARRQSYASVGGIVNSYLHMPKIFFQNIRTGYLSLFCQVSKACQKCKYFQFVLMAIVFYIDYVPVLLLLALAFIFKFVLPCITVWVFLGWTCWKNSRITDNIENFLKMQQILSPRRYNYGDIVAMTSHFKEKLGKGGFGEVYKGELLGCQPVAVKLLRDSKFNGEEFINEVSTIGRIHHINIVQLLGFCSEGNIRALVYEYMPNGSLDKYIFPTKSNDITILTLDKLNDIALGIARGINYLHGGCDVQILHFDIKPQNILLDYNFTPKISDFGLAKLYPKEQNLISISAARGTIGYIAPELISRSFGTISSKSDVYSYGMLILEMAGRRKNVDSRVQNSSQTYYPSWIYDQLAKLEVPNIDETIVTEGLERKLCKVGLWCIQMNPSNRPTMAEVVELLESDGDNVQMPPKPFFTSIDAPKKEHSYMSSSSIELSIIIENDDNSFVNSLP